MKSVGIIANPASGKDIRRIVTYSSAFDNQEKVNIIRRVIMALHATGVRKVYYMPEYYNIIPQALSGMAGAHASQLSEMEFIPLDFHFMEQENDSVISGKLMKELGVGCIITLGGDGTNRAVAKHCGSTPLVPISTGTNNVFPSMVEGTTAGLAAGIVAMYAYGQDPTVLEQRKRLELYIENSLADIALIDLVVLSKGHIGARAMWSASSIQQIFVTQCAPYYIGISSIAGQFCTISPTEPHGMELVLNQNKNTLKSPIAPGIFETVGVESRQLLGINQTVPIIKTPCTIAVDGERNLEIQPGHSAYVQLSPKGPVVVNIQQALKAAAKQGYFLIKDVN